MPSKWIPLEASPEVFNEVSSSPAPNPSRRMPLNSADHSLWARPLGLPEHPLSFQDLFSLDSDFLSFIPLPVKAVLLLFPAKGELQAAREKEEKEAPRWTGDGVWWIKQTISNACGSIGLLHALLNLPDSGPHALKSDSHLAKFKADTLALDPFERAKRLDEADFFEAAHTSAAQAGQSAVPDDLDVDTHFIAFIEAVDGNGVKRVVELDGSRHGPFDRGECTSLLHDVADIVKEKYMARADGDISFNMIVLAGERED